jgi:hypothetical protein
MNTLTELLRTIKHPVKFAKLFWPDVTFYEKQKEILTAVQEADEVVVPAGNMLGKDYIAGFIALSGFMYPQMYFPPEYIAWVESQRSISNPNPHTVRIITTSVKDDHLRVLWGEIGRFVQHSRFPLDSRKGGSYILNHRDIRKTINRQECKISYLRGMVSEKGEGIAGHHAAYTLGLIDEASGIDEHVYTQMGTWAKKIIMIGNPNPCTNFFYRAVKGGDLLSNPTVQ